VKPYRFHPEALAEYEAAAVWYGERSYEGALGFVSVIEDGIAEIRELPEAWPSWPGLPEARRRVLRRFPYSIVFLLEPAEIVIVAVAHHKRRPGYWIGRVSNRR